jgi:acetate kinase
MDELGMDARALEKLIYHESGLLGVSGVSSDMRAARGDDAPGAKAAIDLYVVPDRPRARLARRRARRPRRDRVHGGRRREQRVAARARVPRRRMARHRARRRANRAGATRISAAGSRTAPTVIPTDGGAP